MPETAKTWLKASGKGSYCKQAALLDTEEESDGPGDPSEKSAGPNTSGIMLGNPLETHHPESLVTRPGLHVCVCVCVCVCVRARVCVLRTLSADAWWHAAGM